MAVLQEIQRRIDRATTGLRRMLRGPEEVDAADLISHPEAFQRQIRVAGTYTEYEYLGYQPLPNATIGSAEVAHANPKVYSIEKGRFQAPGGGEYIEVIVKRVVDQDEVVEDPRTRYNHRENITLIGRVREEKDKNGKEQWILDAS